ncbi:outer membrane beta-barrel protein, partial [Mesorhizobium sp. M4B.F.Ca.ET.143.01.1.1]
MPDQGRLVRHATWSPGLCDRQHIPYFTGGLAYGEAEANPDIAGYGGKDTLVGWTAGAGIEHAFSKNWTLKAEYLFVDLGKVDLADFGPPYGRGHADV